MGKILPLVSNTVLRKRSASCSILCIAIASIGFVTGHPHSISARILQSTQEPKSDSPSISDKADKIKFKLTMFGNGRSDDGTWWTKHYLMTSDGHAMYKQCFPFSTVDRANKQFQLYLKQATKIIRRGPELDEKRETTGERVLALFPKDENGKTKYSLFWSSGTQFCEIAGEYSDDILILERRLKEKSLLEIVKESEPEAAQ